MSEIRSGFRHLLARPGVYNLFATVVGAYEWRRLVIEKFVMTNIPVNGTVVDIGCGTGKILSFLPDSIEYLGFDRNADYIEEAMLRYPNRNAHFLCEEISNFFSDGKKKADVVLALGVLHHLDDNECLDLMRIAKLVLRPPGFFLALEPVFDAKQSKLARYFVSKDRGTSVRNQVGYENLARQVFPYLESHVDLDPIRIPYSGMTLIGRSEFARE